MASIIRNLIQYVPKYRSYGNINHIVSNTSNPERNWLQTSTDPASDSHGISFRQQWTRLQVRINRIVLQTLHQLTNLVSLRSLLLSTLSRPSVMNLAAMSGPSSSCCRVTYSCNEEGRGEREGRAKGREGAREQGRRTRGPVIV